MPNIDVEIGSRRYTIACREGEQEHLRAVAALVDAKAREAAEKLGSLGEARQLLFASLLLADALKEQSGSPTTPAPAPEPDTDVAEALERLALEAELLADDLERGARAS